MIHVAQIECLDGYRVRATFSDGATGEYDFAEVIGKGGPMVEPLRDPEYFKQVVIEHGAPTWPNCFDACPDWLRIEIEKSGHISSSQA